MQNFVCNNDATLAKCTKKDIKKCYIYVQSREFLGKMVGHFVMSRNSAALVDSSKAKAINGYFSRIRWVDEGFHRK